jgi:hypothetical protein
VVWVGVIYGIISQLQGDEGGFYGFSREVTATIPGIKTRDPKFKNLF